MDGGIINHGGGPEEREELSAPSISLSGGERAMNGFQKTRMIAPGSTAVFRDNHVLQVIP
jgi:hypothetical protein